jgi:hypothetical protein
MVALGSLYEQGATPVGVDIHMAMKYYEKAAKLGNERGYFLLAFIYQKGFSGIPVDQEKAANYLAIAVAGNNSGILLDLGCYYRDGSDGLPQDINKAIECFEKIKHKSPDAMFMLGNLYINGVGGIGVDQKLGKAYMERASALGHITATLWLGNFYRDCKMSQKAIEYFEKAGNLGSIEAHTFLAHFLEKDGMTFLHI